MYFTIKGINYDGRSICRLYGQKRRSWSAVKKRVRREYADNKIPSLEYFGEYCVIVYPDKVFVIMEEKQEERQ